MEMVAAIVLQLTRNLTDDLIEADPAFAASFVEHTAGIDEVEALCASGDISGIHLFCDSDIFGAVYSTNMLMRVSDVLVTKPSELAFYPIPKMMIKRVGGHEAMNAMRAAELGEATYELETPEEACAMVDLMQTDSSIIAEMCESIVRNGRNGVYDGAYEVVRLAVGE